MRGIRSEYATRISVIHPSHRAHLRMEEGIDWERLAATPERDVNFMKITYAPGAGSGTATEPQVHEGYEYGYVLSGTLEVTVGNEVFVLREGESLGFDSQHPAPPAEHRGFGLPRNLVRPRPTALTPGRSLRSVRPQGAAPAGSL